MSCTTYSGENVVCDNVVEYLCLQISNELKTYILVVVGKCTGNPQVSQQLPIPEPVGTL